MNKMTATVTFKEGPLGKDNASIDGTYWSDRAELKGVKQPSGRLFHSFQPLI